MAQHSGTTVADNCLPSESSREHADHLMRAKVAPPRPRAGERADGEIVIGLTDQTLSCKPHTRASGRAARRLPRCTSC
jgi:hypothetical protein